MTRKSASWILGCMCLVGCGGAVTSGSTDPDAGAGGSSVTSGVTTGGTTGSTTTGSMTTTGGTTTGSTTTGSTTTGSTTVTTTTGDGAGGAPATGGTGGKAGGFGGDFMGTGGDVGMAGAGGGVIDGGPEWGACTGPGQCTPVPLGAVVEGAVTLPASSYAGVNIGHVDEFRKVTCPYPLPCPAISCVQSLVTNVGARCTAGRCEVFDVRTEPAYSQCDQASDCVVRSGLACCSCGGQITAVSRTGLRRLESEVCDPRMSCRSCAPQLGATTKCINHACTATFLL